MSITNTITESLIQLLVTAPLLAWGYAQNKPSDLRPFLFFILVYIIAAILVQQFAAVTLFPHQHWNWTGKAAALLFGLVAAFVLTGFKPATYGLTTRVQWDGTGTLLLVCGIYFIIRIGLYIKSGEATSAINTESLIYQATLPGIQEEIIFRGILMGLLATVLKNPSFEFLHVSFSWPVIITSLLFGLAHGLTYHPQTGLNINYFLIFRSAFDGFLFALLAQKTQSLLPGIIFHNLLNVLGDH